MADVGFSIPWRRSIGEDGRGDGGEKEELLVVAVARTKSILLLLFLFLLLLDSSGAHMVSGRPYSRYGWIGVERIRQTLKEVVAGLNSERCAVDFYQPRQIAKREEGCGCGG